MRMVIRNHGDSIGSRGCKKMEWSSRVMRQSAFIIHRWGDGRRQIAGTKANVYGVFTSCTLGRGVEEKPNRSVRYQSDFLFGFFFFRAKERSSGQHRRILDFSLWEEFAARNALAFIGFRKLENKKKKHAIVRRIWKEVASTWDKKWNFCVLRNFF